MTLKQLTDDISIDNEVIDICVYDEDKDDYTDSFGYCTESGDLGSDLQRSAWTSLDVQAYLKYEVRWMGAYIDNGKCVLRIEIQKPTA